jgi:uncharacterized protein YvpB
VKKEHKPIEIILSTYWPTKIIKSVCIKDPNETSSFHSDITLSSYDAKYVYEQLKAIYELK